MVFKNTKEKINKLENDIYLLNKKIHERNEILILEKMHLEEQKKIYKDEITNENIEIQLRIATIDHLKTIIN